MVFVDTSVWVDFLKARETPEVAQLETLIEDEVDVFTTGIVIQEVLSGIKVRRQRLDVRRQFERLILVMPNLDTHLQAAELFDACQKKGFTIRSGIDCLVAAIAIENQLSLLQKDRDFRFIKKVSPLRILSV